MTAVYISRYEAVFLRLHLKGPKLSYITTAEYMKKSKVNVSEWVKRYSDVKNIADPMT